MLNNLRDSLKPVLQKIGKSFAATGLSPNVFTGIGLALAFVASIIYGIGFEYSLLLGGIALLASGFFDIVDGQVARYANKMSKSGGFLDSIFDKIAEVAIFFGILIGKGKILRNHQLKELFELELEQAITGTLVFFLL